MTPLGGLAFLLIIVAIVTIGVAFLTARERSRAKPRRTVDHFRRSRFAMHKLYRAQLARREAARASARKAHPARHRHKKSA